MPTVADRLKRRLIVLSESEPFAGEVVQSLPSGWHVTRTLGEFADVLLHRFIVLDLDASHAPEWLRRVRSEMNLTIPVFCFGGDQAARDAARLARADRFFERSALAAMLPQLCESFGW